jgi:hypothetical protein
MAAKDVAFTAWANAWMHSWRSEFIASLWEKQSLGYITNIDGDVRLNPHGLGNTLREMVNKDKVTIDSTSYKEAIKRTQQGSQKKAPYSKPTIGYVAQWMSELGRPELDGLLKYADENLNPKWENGGLYYRRNDEPYDKGLLKVHTPTKPNHDADSAQISIGRIWILSQAMQRSDTHDSILLVDRRRCGMHRGRRRRYPKDHGPMALISDKGLTSYVRFGMKRNVFYY